MSNKATWHPYTVPYTGHGAVVQPSGYVSCSAAKGPPSARPPPAPQDRAWGPQAQIGVGALATTPPAAATSAQPFRAPPAVASSDPNDALHHITEPQSIPVVEVLDMPPEAKKRFHGA